MEQHRYQTLLEDPNTFAPIPHLSFLTLDNFERSTGSGFNDVGGGNDSRNNPANLFKKGQLPQDETERWLEDNSLEAEDGASSNTKVVARLRVISASGRSRKRLPLGLSRSTFEAIFERWQLPRAFLYLTSTRRACLSKFDKSGDERHGYIFQTTDIGIRPFGCSLSYSLQHGSVLAFVYGLSNDKFDLVCKEIQHLSDLTGLPTTILLCLLDLKAEVVDQDISACHRVIREIKMETGMHDLTGSSSGRNAEPNFVQISRRLTRLSAMLADCELACEAHLGLIDRLEAENEILLSRTPGDKRDEMAAKVKLLQRKIDILRDWMQANLPRTRFLQKRAQAYVQTVYSLMAKKDNDLNMQTAAASLRVSEASHRDSAAMKALAEDSGRIALATSRDSSLMRIIAILTLVFLPPTFTATLFSTTFFDFKSANQEDIVSGRFWIYWVLTLALTVLTMGSAGYFWKVKDKKNTEAFSRNQAGLEEAVK